MFIKSCFSTKFSIKRKEVTSGSVQLKSGEKNCFKIVTRYGILDHMQIISNFQDGASNPATPCFFDFFFFSFYESTIFPLPTDEVSAMCDAF